MSRRGWTLFALLSIVWGLPYLFIKVAVAEIPVAVLVFARVSLGAAVLIPFALRRSEPTQLRHFWRPLLAFSVLEFIIPWGFLSHAEIRLSSATAGLLMATIPALTVFVERFTGSAEPMRPLRLSGLALGFAGVFVLARPHLGGDYFAVLEALLAALCYAAAAIVAARSLKGVAALPMVASCLGFAAVVYLPAAGATWPTTTPSFTALAAVGALAILCTALAFLWFFALIREVGVGRAVIVTYVNPAVAVAAGVVFLGEPLSASLISALAMILCGSALATAGQSVRRSAAADAAIVPGQSAIVEVRS